MNFYGPGKGNTLSPVGRVHVQEALTRAGQAWTDTRAVLLAQALTDRDFIRVMAQIDELVQAEVALALARVERP